jgi:hypothetical protein
MDIRFLIILVVALTATVLAPVLSDQGASGPDRGVYNALPHVMSPGPGGSDDGLSLEGTLVAYASADAGRRSTVCKPHPPWL